MKKSQRRTRQLFESDKREICECSFTYNRRNHLITAGRRGGTQFVFKPDVFAKLFEVIKHE